MKKLFIILFATFLVCSVIAALYFRLDLFREYPLEYAEAVEKYANEYNVPQDLIYAVINVESGFDSNAVSKSNAKGLMQLMDETAAEIAEKLKITEFDIFNTDTNIRFGVFYLSYLYSVLGDWRNSVAAYNGGIGNVKSWLNNKNYSADGKYLNNIPVSETNAYVKRVFADWEKYKNKLKQKGLE